MWAQRFSSSAPLSHCVAQFNNYNTKVIPPNQQSCFEWLNSIGMWNVYKVRTLERPLIDHSYIPIDAHATNKKGIISIHTFLPPAAIHFPINQRTLKCASFEEERKNQKPVSCTSRRHTSVLSNIALMQSYFIKYSIKNQVSP